MEDGGWGNGRWRMGAGKMADGGKKKKKKKLTSLTWVVSLVDSALFFGRPGPRRRLFLGVDRVMVLKRGCGVVRIWKWCCEKFGSEEKP